MKIPIIDEKDLNELIIQALNGNGVLATPKGASEMINLLSGVSINSKPRKDGRYQGYILDNGKKHYVYARTKDEVAFKIKALLKNGLPKKKEQNKTPQNFNDFAMYYFENFRQKKVAEKTYRSDLNRYNNYLKPCFENCSIKKITPLDCQNLIDNISNEGKGKTADEVYSLLGVILNMAIKHGIINRSPLDIVTHTTHERTHGKALTQDEEQAFISAIQDTKEELSFVLMLYCGLRPNEVPTARIDGKFIVSVNSKRKNKKVQYKKIPITKKLSPYLNKEFNFLPYETMRVKFKQYLPEHIIYDLRTTFYSRCKECNVSEHALHEFMGHSLGAIANAYTDLSDEFLLKEGLKIDY